MNLAQYTAAAVETESRIEVVTVDINHLKNVLDTMIAAGNLLDVIKKDTFYGLPTSPDKVAARRDKLSHNNQQLRQATIETVVSAIPGDSSTIGTLSNINPRIAHAIIGLATEAVELLEALRTAIENETDIDGVNVLEELGDLNWYHAIAVDALNGDWQNIQAVNIAKLRKRNKGKVFNAEATINRDAVAERTMLEQQFGGATAS